MAFTKRQCCDYERFGDQPDQQSLRQKGMMMMFCVAVVVFGEHFIISVRKRLFSRHRRDVSRTVYVDNHLLSSDEHVRTSVYPDNTVVSSKYTLLTFLPKNLFEQFRRIANFYFLSVACIQFIIDTPVTPLTSTLPLIFVISVTAVKQGYEDWLRHQADSDVNMRQAVMIRNGKQVVARAMDIKVYFNITQRERQDSLLVGDIVKVQRNEEFPCDLVMLSSEDPLGQCFVTTANLDGETNLKTFVCLHNTRHCSTPSQLGRLRARITCKPHVADLYTFQGVMELEGETGSKSLGPENLLLRGARLKNTEFIFGCAVFTGKDTKMALNSKSKKTKFSRVERKMNTYLIVFLVVLLLESVVSTVLKYLFEARYGIPWYVPKESSRPEIANVIENALAFMILFNYIIPISLYVTVEMQKFLGSLFFSSDREMYDPTINEYAQANTSDLNEELGQVEYLFTDKTGTLTENTMMFRKCCIGSRQFEVVDEMFCERMDSGIINLASDVQFTEEMNDFFKVLVLCHTVRVDQHLGQYAGETIWYGSTAEGYEYQASSPDEKALVEACCKYGVIYHGTRDNILQVSFHQQMKRFQLLHTLPFDPMRKRMSIIIQDENGEYVLLCKGAEIAILDRVVNGDVDRIQNLINEYAVLGLRTLTMAERKLSLEEFRECDEKLTKAKQSLQRREEMLAEAYNAIEQRLTLLGATAVEDKLQDQVPQTIEALRMAGIKVWVLTGDKEETAVNISHSAGHFNSDMQEIRLTRVTTAEQCELQLQELLKQTALADPQVNFALIIDGQSLVFAIRQHTEVLRQLCSRCVAVLCCRMSPIQKAEVVAMIKNSPGRPVTAAIGDGANDVSMIQEADVGLGIMGKEGRQAVRNSDYAFGKFKFVRRALLLHGHLYYNRIAILVQYFFYKNVAWITAQFFYAIFNSFSEQSLFDPFFLVFYNLTFTSLPILFYGLFEQHIPKEVLMNNPQLYRNISKNSTMSWSEFFRWNVLGLWHCMVFFFGFYFLQWTGVSIFSSGVTISNFDFGTLILVTCAASVNIKLMLETYYWCLPTVIAYTITFVGMVFLAAVYTNVFFPSFLVNHRDMYNVFNQIYSTPTTWLTMVLLISVALLPDVVIRVCRDTKCHRFQRGCTCCQAGPVGMADGEVTVMPDSSSRSLQEENEEVRSSSETLKSSKRTERKSKHTSPRKHYGTDQNWHQGTDRNLLRHVSVGDSGFGGDDDDDEDVP